MRISDIVVNMLVFADGHAMGMSQLEMLRILTENGFTKAEVRREFIRDLQQEPEEIGAYARDHDMEMFYSVPETLYAKGTLCTDEMKTYFAEARTMNSRYVKVVIGTVEEVTQEDVDMMNQLCREYSITLMVENDQTQENGKAKKICTFLKQYTEKGGEIGTTFDTGNWIFVNEDPVENARQLCPYVKYVHIKDIESQENPRTVFLNEGIIPWQELLEIFPKEVPVALEYPMGKNAAENLVAESEKLCGKE